MQFNNISRPDLIKEYFYLLEQRNSGSEANFPAELTRYQEEELSLIEQEMSSARQYLYYVKKQLSEPVPPFSLELICRYLPSSIVLDFQEIYSIFILKKQKPLIIISISLILFILLLSLVGTNILVLIIIIYTILKFYSARHLYENNWSQQLKIKYQTRQEVISALEQKQQQLNTEIKKIKDRENNSNVSRLKSLELEIKKRLEEDEEQLVKIGLEKLQIASSELDAQRRESELDRPAIISLVGVTDDEVDKSFIVANDRVDEYLDKSSRRELLIRKEDFYEQKGLDGKYKYGVYEFVSIFIVENFLAYYRCYWNFVRGAAVDEETCEYLYDAIVSVKTEERSSLNQKNPNERRNYKQILSITTMDGKTISFQIGNDRKAKIDSTKDISNYSSKIDEEARRIRYWLRKRPVYIQKPED